MRSEWLSVSPARLAVLALVAGLFLGASPASAQRHGSGYRGWAHGGWAHGSFFYYPQFGFGRAGDNSWCYGNMYPSSRIVGYHGVIDSNAYGSQYYSFAGADTDYVASARHDAWMSGYQQRARDERLAGVNSGAVVRLRIEPKEAALFLDGNPIGSAEHFSRHKADLRLPPGKYLLEAAVDGYTVLGEELDLKAGQTLEIARQLRKSDVAVPDLNAVPDPAHPGSPTRPTGILLLSGSPADARVLLDGRFLCYGSMLADIRYLHRIPAGPHTIEVSRGGYRTFREEIVISPLRPMERNIELDRENTP